MEVAHHSEGAANHVRKIVQLNEDVIKGQDQRVEVRGKRREETLKQAAGSQAERLDPKARYKACEQRQNFTAAVIQHNLTTTSGMSLSGTQAQGISFEDGCY